MGVRREKLLRRLALAAKGCKRPRVEESKSRRDSNFGQRGSGLLEMMIALALALTVVGAFFTALRPLQGWASDLGRLSERDTANWMLPGLMAGWIAPAGNNRQAGGWDGLLASAATLRIESDLEGDGGFPDGRSDDRFERLTLRVRRGDLQVRSGRGFFQPAARGISRFRPSRESERLLSVEIQPSDVKSRWRASEWRGPAVQWLFALPNYRPNLFAEVER